MVFLKDVGKNMSSIKNHPHNIQLLQKNKKNQTLVQNVFDLGKEHYRLRVDYIITNTHSLAYLG